MKRFREKKIVLFFSLISAAAFFLAACAVGSARPFAAGSLLVCAEEEPCVRNQAEISTSAPALNLNYYYQNLAAGSLLKARWVRAGEVVFAVSQFRVEEAGSGLAAFILRRGKSLWPEGEIMIRVYLDENAEPLAELPLLFKNQSLGK